MDRASQAEVKYREALEDALRAAREHGDTSSQAVAAWDIVDEIEVRVGVFIVGGGGRSDDQRGHMTILLLIGPCC